MSTKLNENTNGLQTVLNDINNFEIPGLNIAYGTTPPDDKSKLWVPLAKKPDNVEISGDSLQNAVDAIQTMVEKFPVAGWYRAPAAAVNGKIYTFGGVANIASVVDTIYEYDPSTDKIAAKNTTLPLALSGMAAVSLNDKVYLFGGYNSSDDNKGKEIYEYDPSTDTLVAKSATLAQAVRNPVASAANGKIYVFGGVLNTGSVTASRKRMYEYDPDNDTLVRTDDFIEDGIHSAPAVTINNKIYMFGGSDKDGDPVNKIREYDPTTNTLTVKTATLPNVRHSSSAVALNGKAYIFGGRNNTNSAGGYFSEIFEYDPLTDVLTTKTTVALPTKLAYSAAAVVDDRAYIFGGSTGNGKVNTIQEYTPKAYLGANHLKVFASVFNTGEHQVVTNIVNGKKEQLKLYMTSAFIGDDDGYAKAQDAYVYNTSISNWQTLEGTSL